MEDYERVFQKDNLILQADQWEEEQRIMKELMEEERLPATISVTKQIDENDENNHLAFRGDSEEGLFTGSHISA